MELWQLYLLVTLPSASELMTALAITMLLVGLGTSVVASMATMEEDEHAPKLRKWAGGFLITCFVSALLAVAIPSQSGLYTMLGGYYVTNVEGVEDLPPAAVKAANRFLESYAEDSE